MARGLARQACSMNGKHFNVDEVHNAVEKYKTILQAPESRDNSDKYMNQLREQSGYRDKASLSNRRPTRTELNARAEEAISRKNRRYERFSDVPLVKSHLIKAGWDPIDFPSLDDRDFRTLVYKDQQITAKIWQNIKPKLEPLIQRKRDIRLEREKQNRRRQRMQATASLYLRTAQNTVAISIRPWTLSLLIPEHRLIHASPPVKELLELDMETVTAEHWLDVADDVRLFVRRHWKVVQQNVLDIVEGRTALMHAEGAIQEDGDNESLAQDIEEITKKLASVTAAFVCKSGACRTVHWFPEMFDHLSSSCRGQVFNQILKLCEPLDEQRRQLVRRMVADIGLNADTATQADVRDLQNLICTRCHHDTARYSSFSMIASHYIQAQRWYAFVKQAKEMHSHPHQVNDDHDWTSNNAPLIRQYNGAERAFLESSQAVFQAQLSTEPKRICKLCPRDLGPLPCSTSMMEIHIRSKHGKEPEWDADTSRDTYFATYPCPT
ncbi:hypothetical protein FRB90_006808 [Tulasnella sp. 427]|nr:hypothetical protein FRB90_006808 [Tulasnella sp. 427]